ncbi:MAG: 2-C-methyl-D-erythritol 4-phosphate cytidylyltransferase, partial [Schwartzia sp.]|nr:2-C-methyl-D-erythritol 4-phosphate cytidylyltransferase [Schwartzia sp. (in: firmicutes)]
MNIALILSGGTGARLGGEIPKQYLPCRGPMMITRCLNPVFAHEALDAVQIVAADGWRDAILREMETFVFAQNASRG